ncbi:hypothetical protein MKY88_19505 [Lysinibacillus sp. FSL R7-0073]|uniref:hypothetical protein n=1 Tax=Lysinibacillus sp. FSL R7-0073 TaxID=2921669 RepID=UPI0030F9B2D8
MKKVSRIENIVIYYQQKKDEINKQSIAFIKSLIIQLEKQYVIKGVFIDQYNDRSEFYNFINTSPKNISVIFISLPLDKFDQTLLDEVAKVGNLYITYNSEYNNL